MRVRFSRFVTRRRTRQYTARRARFSRKTVLTIIFAGTFLISAGLLAAYAADYVRARKSTQQLQDIYYAETPAPTTALTATPQPKATPVPAITPIPEDPSRLKTVYYPGNASARVSERFAALQRQNADIIGWLRIDNMLDEPVVQRDNEYYLRRDARGYHNVNGAVFLDEDISLKTRPYTITLYGHNMKTGAMFGALRNYENIVYYKNNPFISFDSAYEDGRYVVFAIATFSTQSRDRHFLDLYKLMSDTITWRQESIDKLKQLSIYTTSIDVQPDDQLLLLVTCVEDETERRVVAARRLRPGESELKAKDIVAQSRNK